MKNRLRHITYSWIVLICFAVGQVTAFSHQHLAVIKSHSSLSKQTTSGQTVKEKCYVCDAMHHTSMAVFTDVTPIIYVTTVDTQYTREHDYKGIALILSADRGPPVA
ncbi:hypothetical protein KXQ82_10045 [Mucilaginibacter sp. HMF5004]|uniref:hypothetical protein n=1 Tax=Mucilaginibacter rivuli TaxID=2857527 RepID=UPI001C5F880C|nr:hypothetical protein [Mucilaginibacter rivuli]MBW4890059.1 hypothetical protein [Mucilaginibacter rivuli]